MKFKFAQDSDAKQIAEIYAPFIQTTITFENTAPGENEFIERINNISKTYPWIVIEEDNQIKGYGYLSTFNPRTAYQHTADLSIYLDEDTKGKGIGRKICEILFEIAKRQNIHRIVSLITEENTPSKAFHEKLGFSCQGTLENVGYKHERWLNVSFYVLNIQNTPHPQSLIPFEQMKEKAQEILDQFNQNI